MQVREKAMRMKASPPTLDENQHDHLAPQVKGCQEQKKSRRNCRKRNSEVI